MKKIILNLLTISIAFSYSKCNLNKMQMKCDYYVVKNGLINKIDECKKYAIYLDNSKVYDKAAWYYLVAKLPNKSIISAKKALKNNELYVYEYLAHSYLILKDYQKAKKYYKLIPNKKYNLEFIKKNILILKRLYKDFDINFINNFI